MVLMFCQPFLSRICGDRRSNPPRAQADPSFILRRVHGQILNSFLQSIVAVGDVAYDFIDSDLMG